MKNIVPSRYAFAPASANLTGLGLLFALAAIVQIWYWFQNFALKHADYLLDMALGVVSSPYASGKVICFVGVAYHLMFAWIVLWLLYIGVTLIRLSWDRNVRLMQSGGHKLEMLKAICFLAVVFLISFWIAPAMRPPNPQVEIIGVELMAMLMAGYSLIAIIKYRGKM